VSSGAPDRKMIKPEESPMKLRKDEPILKALKTMGRPPAVQAAMSYRGFVAADYNFYKSAEKEVGEAKARQIHAKGWAYYVPMIVAESKEAMGMHEIKTVPDVGRVARYFYDSIDLPLKPVEDGPTKFVGMITIDPIIDCAKELFNLEIGCSYFKSLSKVFPYFFKEVIIHIGQKDNIRFSQDKFIGLGDGVTRITFETRKKT
jgi:hypothetical protein